jgi:hypothetical protein
VLGSTTVRLSGLVVAASLVLSRVGLADPTPDDLQAQGEQLAKDGRYTDAIDAFKAAFRLDHKASHTCFIALAYTRRELWPQAEIFLDQCHTLATPDDVLPTWVPIADKQIAERLSMANVAPVEITVEPADAHARISVSSFAPDEVFAPRTIHLPPGRHQLVATAPGYEASTKVVDVVDRTPQHLAITLARAGAPTSPTRPAPLTKPTRPPESTLPRALIVAGGITAGVGVLTFVWLGFEWSKLDSAPDPQTFSDHEGSYKLARISTIGLWGVGAGLVVTGVILGRRQHGAETPAISAVPLPGGGGMVSIGWQQ